MATRGQREWLDPLEAVGVPCGPTNRVDQVFEDPQVRHRQLLQQLPHPLAGSVPQVVAPFRLSATPLAFDRPPPLLGEHTEAVLRDELGIAPARLRELAQAGVIGLSPNRESTWR
jgi:crotonobetainyl-CoA:carnitine CoA-transferase CaiB-like acyl-CoA transferase